MTQPLRTVQRLPKNLLSPVVTFLAGPKRSRWETFV